MQLNSKQLKILQKIIDDNSKSIIWDDVEKLMKALGAGLKQGKGSAGIFTLGSYSFPFHRPHPQKEAKPYQIRALKQFLIKMEIIHE